MLLHKILSMIHRVLSYFGVGHERSPVAAATERNQLESLSRQRLWLQVLIAIALGVGFGVLFGPTTGLVSADTSVLIGNWVALPGKLFLLAIQFVVVPLIVASVIRGIADEGASGSLGILGARTVSFFVLTTLAAVAIGLFVAGVIKPGNYIDNLLVSTALSESGAGGTHLPRNRCSTPRADEIPDLIVSLFPRDPLTTFVGGNMLQIVVAAAIIGIALVMTSAEQRRPVIDLLASIQAACMVIVGWALRFTPIAVFGLLAQISSRVGLSVLLGTGMYVLSVLVGLLFLFLFYLAIVKLVTRQSVIGFLSAGREVILLAFSTSSSAAVMPVTLTVAEQKLNVRPQVARFVVPLGTTINMGGTALYQGVATLFLAQVFGIEIGMTGLLLVVVMATGAAIGSPGTPGVGIVILATILNSVGVPAEGIALILGVDRLLDMCRTAVNVTGDLVGCVTIDRSLAEPDALSDKK